MADIDTNLRLGELVEKYVPQNKLAAGIVDAAIRQQAALLVAEELGANQNEKYSKTIPTSEEVIEDLRNLGFNHAEDLIEDAINTRIGRINELPSSVPSFGVLLGKSLPFDVKDALLAAQAAARIEAALEGATFAPPRIGDKDPAYLKDAQTSLQAILAAKAIEQAITDEDKAQYRAAADRAIAGANASWQKAYGQDLISAPISASPAPDLAPGMQP